jgi:hypothetical protein
MISKLGLEGWLRRGIFNTTPKLGILTGWGVLHFPSKVGIPMIKSIDISIHFLLGT